MTSVKKQERAERKRKKLLAEYDLAQSNDAVKRPGELLDSDPVEVKKERLDTSGNDEKRLSEEEFKKLKKQLADRKKFLQQLPRFSLQYEGVIAHLGNDYSERVPILMSDIQHLLVYALCGNSFTTPPHRWCALQKSTRITNMVALVVEGVTATDFLDYEHVFETIASEFPDRVEVHAPVHYGSRAAAEFSCFPVTAAQKEHILSKYGSMDAAMGSREIMKSYRAIFPIAGVGENSLAATELAPSTGLPGIDMFPRTFLLLSTHQMMMENFPLPFAPFDAGMKYKGYEMTKMEYREATHKSPMFAIDCEMCLTDKQKLELTHIAVVNEKLEVVYETLVKPRNRIINYLTKFSGITEAILRNVHTRLEDVQAALRELLPHDAILVGHSLNSDLQALNLAHPYVIDTSVIYNLTGNRKRKSKLAMLMDHFLGETIQACKKGHSPSEDAKAAMKLVQLKLSKGFNFGDSITTEVGKDAKEAAVPQCQITTSVFNSTHRAQKTVAVIGKQKDLDHYTQFQMLEGVNSSSYAMIRVSKPKEAISQLQSAAVSYNFSIAHIDISKKVNKCATTEEREKVFRKLDTWCREAFSYVSLNGLCVVVFAGKTSTGDKSPSSCDLINGNNNNNNVNNSGLNSLNGTGSSSVNGSAEQEEGINSKKSKSEESNARKDSRRITGAAFVRVKSPKGV